jgi:hypothetical protein
MMKLFILLPLFILFTACTSVLAPINSDFSCNATADDRCLSIEEVNEMTKINSNDIKPKTNCKSCQQKRRVLDRRTQSIWIPPEVDAKGQVKPANVVIADLDKNQIIA